MIRELVLEPAWRSASTRFEERRTYIEASDRVGPSDPLYRQNLYAGWILLLYAAYEASLTLFGEAVLTLVSTVVENPLALPSTLRKTHLDRTIGRLVELAGRPSMAQSGMGATAEDLILTAYTSQWAEQSNFMIMDRNAWPDRVREWLARIDISGGRLAWMKQPFGTSSETIESQVAALVAERNDLAHGKVPSSVLDQDLMRERVAVVKEFSRKTYGSIACGCAEQFPEVLSGVVGLADPSAPVLGQSSAAIEMLREELKVNDHVLLHEDGAPVRFARVLSLQQDGQDLQEGQIGDRRVAVTLDREVRSARLYRAI